MAVSRSCERNTRIQSWDDRSIICFLCYVFSLLPPSFGEMIQFDSTKKKFSDGSQGDLRPSDISRPRTISGASGSGEVAEKN